MWSSRSQGAPAARRDGWHDVLLAVWFHGMDCGHPELIG
ncbi:hypothetical protein BZL30_6010 [Mycobacterium kansasii]|uniref:Uncharacterized protein n=1 Tax=Mycobacterium kansasii TaxID=1768 RepID=A0A1V3WTN9_MYCKA|nr:hypothetical protein BZL30_6010 [Mycobacterium kansasii]